MRTSNFFRGFNWWLFATAILAFILILCINLWFCKIPEVFDNASVLGDINTALLCSYLAAYIFYLITSYYKEFKVRKSARIPLCYNLSELIKIHNNFTKTIDKYIKCKYIDLTEKEKQEALTQISVTAQPPKLHDKIVNMEIPNTWNDYMTWHRQVIEKKVRYIYDRYAFLMEVELSDILSQIENSDFHEKINMVYQRPDLWSNLGSLYTPMKEYIIYFENLRKYVEKM